MFAHLLGHSQIEYFRNAIDLNRKDRAKPPARRGFSAYASESDTINLQSSIVNIQFRLVRVGYIVHSEILFSLFVQEHIRCCQYILIKVFLFRELSIAYLAMARAPQKPQYNVAFTVLTHN